MPAQNVADGLIGNRVTQVGHRADDAVVAPAGVFPRHPDDERFQFFIEPWPPWILAMLGAIKLLRDQLSTPGQDRVGLCDTSDFPQCLPSHALSDLGQGDAFRVGQSQPGRKFRTEDPVFRRQILILEE